LAPFTPAEIEAENSAWDLFQNGAIVLFRRPEILSERLSQLASAGYRTGVVECPDLEEIELLSAMAHAVGAPRYPLMSLSAFSDSLSQIDFGSTAGVVLALHGFHTVEQRFPETAHHILNILADNQRQHLLLGDRFLTLLQSNDPHLDQKIGLVGGFTPIWNHREWLNADREGSG